MPFPSQHCHLGITCPTNSISTCPNRPECRRVTLAITNGQRRYHKGWTIEVSNGDSLWGLKLYTPAKEMDSHQYWEVESIEDAFASAQLYIDSLSESGESGDPGFDEPINNPYHPDPQDNWSPPGTAYYNGELILLPPQRLIPQQQLEALDWHPVFTGRCPNCELPMSLPSTLGQWHCERGWQLES